MYEALELLLIEGGAGPLVESATGGAIACEAVKARAGHRDDKLHEISASLSTVHYAAAKGLAACWGTSMSAVIRRAVHGLLLTEVWGWGDRSGPWGVILSELGVLVDQHPRDVQDFGKRESAQLSVDGAERLCRELRGLDLSGEGRTNVVNGIIREPKVTINVGLTATAIAVIRQLTGVGAYVSQSEFVRSALRLFLAEVAWAQLGPSLDAAHWTAGGVVP